MGEFFRKNHEWSEAAECFKSASKVCNTKSQRQRVLNELDSVILYGRLVEEALSSSSVTFLRSWSGEDPTALEALITATPNLPLLEPYDLAMYRFNAALKLFQLYPSLLLYEHLGAFAKNPDACFLMERLLDCDLGGLEEHLASLDFSLDMLALQRPRWNKMA